MRSLMVVTFVFLLGCGDRTHEASVRVPTGSVSGSGQIETERISVVPCGVELRFEFLDGRIVRIRVVNSNTIPVKVVLKNERTGVHIVICANSQGTAEATAAGGNSFGQLGDRLTGDVSLQKVPGAQFFCLDGRTDGFDVCSGLVVTLTM